MSFPNVQNCKGVFCQAESVAKIPTPFPSAGKTSAVIHDKLNWLFSKNYYSSFVKCFFKRNSWWVMILFNGLCLLLLLQLPYCQFFFKNSSTILEIGSLNGLKLKNLMVFFFFLRRIYNAAVFQSWNSSYVSVNSFVHSANSHQTSLLPEKISFLYLVYDKNITRISYQEFSKTFGKMLLI